MRSKIFFFLLFAGIISANSYAQDYKTIWDHINKNERSQATSIIEAKLKNNSASVDEFITYNFLKAFDGQEDGITDFWKHINASDNSYAYIYALWFTTPVVGGYGYREPHQIALLNYLIDQKPGNGTLRASAHYSLSHHFIKTHQFAMQKNENEKIAALSDWQFVGPFNNISGSGFNKNYEPVKDPSDSSVFMSTENAPIKWFTPIAKSTEGWEFVDNFISSSAGSITFAQTFVNSPTAQDVNLCTGFLGNLKVWVNDQLLISVPEEKVTELDAFCSKCHLNAGYNRVLIQIGSDDDEPNFIIRLTDANFDPLINLTATATPQKYQKIGGESLGNDIPQFAEEYFKEKIKKDSSNILNYILLNRTYLRNKKVFEARKIIERALALEPNNSLLTYELSLCYQKEDNRQGISETFEYFKEKEKQSLISYMLRINELEDQKKYQEALDTLEVQEKLYGSDESTYDDKIQLLSKLDNVPKLLALVEEANKKFPRDARFVNYVFNIEKNVNKDPKKALKVLEKYLENNYSYDLNKLMMKEYFSQNNSKKPYQILQEQIDAWPYDPTIRLDLLNEYLDQQRYKEAFDLCNYMLQMKPYSGYYYDNKASVEGSLGKTDDAIKSYQMALTYQPTLYESREKQRKLENKKSLFELAPQEKVEDLISKTGKNIDPTDYDYYFLQSEQTTVLYPEGGREEETTDAIKILNQRGIDRYKETQIPYNGNTESLIIEDAQLIKANGKKVKPEINDNQIVWTGLEANDVIYVKYKKKYYLHGKFAREYYDKFNFDSSIPVELSRFTLIIPDSKKFNYQVINGDVKPQISDFENYKMYVWKKDTTKVLKDETYMPAFADIATTLHISTISDWNEIAQWYSDVVYSKIAHDYEVTETYHKLFDGKNNLSSDDKAKIIYNYIADNINYSSVAFRQSGLIPQKASKTINTRLGDCKDISTLFVSLANLCGLKANLVLVDTRDNGKKDMLLPSFLFNHCIVKYFDEKNNERYLELTDRNIPFKSLPHDLFQASSLTIPTKDDMSSKYSLQPINTSRKTKDKVLTQVKINISGSDMNIASTSTKYGNMSNWMRGTYRSLSKEKTNEKMQESLSKQFTNPVTVSDVSFNGLDKLLDSISYTVNMNVNNDVKKIGQQSAFTVPFTDVILSAAPFNLEKRKYDFEYWDYEYADEYETKIEIDLPSDKVFADVPKSEKLSFNDIKYSISYTKTAPNKLIVERHADIDRNNITPEDYNKFKSFVSKVVDKEGSYITFKDKTGGGKTN